jgi:soluble lytic murein transglycosylase-like protein
VIPVAAAAVLSAPATASAAFPHVVAAGESLSAVAASDGLTVDQLAAANGLAADASLLAGSTLMIPPRTEEAAGSGAGAGESAASEEAAPETSEGGSNAGSYVVQPGDTLSAIAAQAGTSTDELAATNGIDPAATLLAGAVVRLPGASTDAVRPASSAAQAQSAASSEGAGETAEASSNAPPYPTEETVTPSEVGSIAAENGVPPSLAKAIASQESGFNNNLTSSAGARGVMQIMPETWSSIGQELAGSTPLAAASAASNVRGGVLLLRSLLDSTGGDSALAAAAYYQGLASVQEEGEEPATEQYVESVLALRQQFGGE